MIRRASHITPQAEGLVSIELPSGACTDALGAGKSSQAAGPLQVTYVGIYFDGGIDQDHLFYVDTQAGDNSANLVYEYDRQQGWQPTPGLTVQDVLGYVRDAYNPYTGKVFTIFQDRVEYQGTRP